MKKSCFKILFLILVLDTHLFASSNVYAIFSGRNNGLFADFSMALTLCQAYVHGIIQGGKIDFNKGGLYYDSKHGPNWWQYYFEPLNLGTSNKANIFRTNFLYWEHIEYINSRAENHQLIKQFIRVKPNILAEVDNFVKSHFNADYIIGVHYRGTDKKAEAPSVCYREIFAVIEKQIATLGSKSWKIFLATDEQLFKDLLFSKFPGNVCCCDHLRSEDGKALHITPKDPYQVGKEAVIDCLLLSRTHLIIRTSSNLSFFSSVFNPNIPVIKLNERFSLGDLHRLKNVSRSDPSYYFKNFPPKK